jgi:hypothetical protein
MHANYQNVKIGDKVKFIETNHFWFVNMIEDANDLLVKNKVYTLSEMQVNSSSTIVKLKETNEARFSLSWFDKV